jgi:uncharacterized HAD superfamily protein
MAELDPQMQIDQSHIAAMDGAHQALEKLKQRYTLVVVTAREPEWETATTVWLEANFPGTFREMVIVGREGVKNRNKGQLCKDIGAEWLIDDNPEHARNAIEEGIKVVLFGTYGWHQDVPSDMPHCKTWTEVEEFFYGQN